ncbi:hypothetical protein XELAEV_18018034mg, partial [Xenopus laevis]
LPEDAAALFHVEGLYPERFVVPPWYEYYDYRNRKYGVLLNVCQNFVRRVHIQVKRRGRGKWTADLTICQVIGCSTVAVSGFYHVRAWDAIFTHGVLGSLLLQDQMPLEDIKVGLMQLMAGAIDSVGPVGTVGVRTKEEAFQTNKVRGTRGFGNRMSSGRIGRPFRLWLPIGGREYAATSSIHVEEQGATILDAILEQSMTSLTLQWAMYKLARTPSVQEKLRSEVVAAENLWVLANTRGAAISPDLDLTTLLKRIPLVKAALKENVDSLLNVGWGGEPTHFRGLWYGYGPRQCIGRRIAKMEMQLFLIHILQNFKIENVVDVGTTFNLILFPSKPIILTLHPLK